MRGECHAGHQRPPAKVFSWVGPSRPVMAVTCFALIMHMPQLFRVVMRRVRPPMVCACLARVVCPLKVPLMMQQRMSQRRSSQGRKSQRQSKQRVKSPEKWIAVAVPLEVTAARDETVPSGNRGAPKVLTDSCSTFWTKTERPPMILNPARTQPLLSLRAGVAMSCCSAAQAWTAERARTPRQLGSVPRQHTSAQKQSEGGASLV